MVLMEEGLAGRPPGGRLFLGEEAGRQAVSRGKELCERSPWQTSRRSPAGNQADLLSGYYFSSRMGFS